MQGADDDEHVQRALGLAIPAPVGQDDADGGPGEREHRAGRVGPGADEHSEGEADQPAGGQQRAGGTAEPLTAGRVGRGKRSRRHGAGLDDLHQPGSSDGRLEALGV